MRKISSLSAESIDKIKTYRFDQIIDRHEGPESWELTMRCHEVEFLEIEGYAALLPIGREHHPNVTILKTLESKDGNTITIFLRDTTYLNEPDDEDFWTGFMAVLFRVPEEDFYIATVYHEWLIMYDFLNAF